MEIEEHAELTLAQVSSACAVRVECIVELVDEGLLLPEGGAPGAWRFSRLHLRRAGVALRLQRDLGVNPAGAALALHLLDQLEDLRRMLGGGR